MNGIYLNDIRVDLFLKYLNKDNLASKNYEPVPENLTVYIYNFTINSTGSYFYKSIFNDFNHVKPEIVKYFQDLYPGLVEGDLGLDDSTTEIDGKIYYNSWLELAVPYQYYIEIIGSPDNTFYYFPEIEWNDDNILSIYDSRDGTDLSLSGTTIYDPVEGRYNINDGSSIIGYIYENLQQTVYKTDINGNIVYLDDFGNETLSSSKESIFLKHNQAMRYGFKGITDVDTAIGEKFNNRCVGIVDDRTSKSKENFYFAYYEKYLRTTTYTVVDPADIPGSYLVQYLPRSLLKKLEENGDTYTTEEYNNISKNILSINSVKRVEAKKINGSTYEILDNTYILDITTDNEPILVDSFKEVVVFQKQYDVLELSPNKYINDNIESRKVFIKKISGIDYLEFPFSSPGILRYMDRNGNIIKKTQELRNGKYYINIDGQYYEKMAGPLGSHGLIYIPIKIEKIYGDTYFGKVASVVVNTNKFSMTKYTFTSPTEFLDSESTSTVYKKDSIDSSIAIKIETVYSRVAPGIGYTFNQFLGGTTAEVSLTQLKEIFKYNHYLTLGYYADRGAIVPSGVFRDERANMIRKMVPEFIEKRYNNFAISDENIFDIDALLKMRIYAESFQSIIENDHINSSVPATSRTASFSISDLEPKMILSNEADLSEPILVKKLSDYSQGNYSIENLNQFQRLTNYKEFQNIESYNSFMMDTKLREAIYVDFDNLEEIKDYINVPQIEATMYSPSILEYKNAITNDLVNNFFKFNYYKETISKNSASYSNINDEFVKNYEIFYKNRLDNMSDLTTALEDSIPRKLVYSLGNLNVQEIVSKVIESDWSVL